MPPPPSPRPGSLAHMRRIAEMAQDSDAFTPHAAAELEGRGAGWLLLLLPIVEAVAALPPGRVYDGGSDGYDWQCLICGGTGTVEHGGEGAGWEDADGAVVHEETCVWIQARRLADFID